MPTKTELRQQMLKQRSQMAKEQYLSDSKAVSSQLLASVEYRQANTILCYASCRQEVETTDIISHALADGKIVAVPKVKGPSEMVFLTICSAEDLAPGFCGIAEPDENCQEEITAGLMLVPGTAFDRHLHRMGYGGGYYDTWLEKYSTSVTTCGLAYDFQLLSDIPVASHDQAMDMIITPTIILRKRDV